MRCLWARAVRDTSLAAEASDGSDRTLGAPGGGAFCCSGRIQIMTPCSVPPHVAPCLWLERSFRRGSSAGGSDDEDVNINGQRAFAGQSCHRPRRPAAGQTQANLTPQMRFRAERINIASTVEPRRAHHAEQESAAGTRTMPGTLYRTWGAGKTGAGPQPFRPHFFVGPDRKAKKLAVTGQLHTLRWSWCCQDWWLDRSGLPRDVQADSEVPRHVHHDWQRGRAAAPPRDGEV